MSIRLKITLSEGGQWLTVDLEPEVALAMLTSGRLFGTTPVYAVLFPGGLIYDFVVTLGEETKILKEDWRIQGWADSKTFDSRE